MPNLTTIPAHAFRDALPFTDWNAIKDNVNYLTVAGAGIAAGTTLVTTNEFHSVTGASTTIDNISPAAPVTGQQARLLTVNSQTFRNNGGGSGNIRITSGADKVTKPNEVAVFIYDGTNWRDVPTTGNVIVATTVTGLGVVGDGQQGMIRAGTTPFDYVPLVYDATYGHWIGDNEVVAEMTGKTNNTFTSAAYANTLTALTEGSETLLPWRIYNTAGLKWQFKWTANISWATGQTAAGVALSAITADVGAGLSQDTVNIFAEDLTFTANATKLKAVTWTDVHASVTLKDFLAIQPRAKSDGTRSVSIITGAFTVEGRLVSI